MPTPTRPPGLRARLAHLRDDDAGMSTAEYAIGTIAAAAFGALLYTVITGYLWAVLASARAHDGGRSAARGPDGGGSDVPNDQHHQLVTDLLRALRVGPVTIEHRRDLTADGLVSAYRPGEGVIELNPDAPPERQAAGLMSALRRLGHSARPALHAVPAATDHPAARVVGGP